MYGGRKGVLELMKKTIDDDDAKNLSQGLALDFESETDYHNRYKEINYGRNRAERRRNDAISRRKKSLNKAKVTRRKSGKKTHKRPSGN